MTLGAPQASHVGLLSVEQSLADYAAIIHHLRDVHSAWGCPLMVFGGSLAGKRDAWPLCNRPLFTP